MARAALPDSYRTRGGSVLENWSSLTAFVDAGPGAGVTSIAAGETAPLGGAVIAQAGAATGDHNFQAFATHAAMDISAGDDRILSAQVFLPDDFLGSSVNLQIGKGGFTNSLGLSLNSPNTLKGWNLYSFALSEMILNGSLSDADKASMDSLRMKVSAVGAPRTVKWGPVRFGFRARSKVMVTFDDTLDDVFEVARPLMNDRGLPGTCFVGGNNAGGATTMSVAELATLQSEGWDIASHGFNQSVLTGLTASEVRFELATNRDWLRGNGFARAADFYAYGGGQYDDLVRDEARKAGIKAARSTQATQIHTAEGVLQPDLLAGYSFDSGGFSVTQILGFVDEAIRSGRSIILFGHGIVPSSPSATEILTADFTTLVDALKSRRDLGLIDCVTISAFWNGLSGQRVCAAA